MPVSGARRDEPLLVIGHRGASGYRPEHTIGAYELAARMGADAIDVDLVITADGVLVVRHDNELSTSTDVARHPELAHRRTTRTVDGVTVSGWFAEDLTLTEVKSLRVVERIPSLRPANTAWDGVFEVLTFGEVIDLRERLSAELGREVAIAPELKHPTHYEARGLPVENRLIAALARAGLDRPGAPVIVQCFETGALKRLREDCPALVLLQLTDPTAAPPDLVAAGDHRTYADLCTPEGLEEIATYADVLGPHTVQVHPRSAAGRVSVTERGGASSLVRDAHAVGLRVIPYTLRPENTFLPAELRIGTDLAGRGDVEEEARRLWAAGVDGLFADVPDIAVASRQRFAPSGSSDPADHPGGTPVC